MNAIIPGNDFQFDQIGTGPTVLVLHDDPARQQALLDDCAPLAARLRVVVVRLDHGVDAGAKVVALMKGLGIGRAVAIAIGTANYTLVNLLEKHSNRIAAASFVADRALAQALRKHTDEPRIHALLRSGRRASIARAVARTCPSASTGGAVREWAARIVYGCRAGIRNCAGVLTGLELPGLIQLDDGEELEEVAADSL